ncbi:phage protease [Aliivibrio fischeri]
MLFKAICKDLSGNAPEWVQILPSGPDIQGLDGRSWKSKSPEALVHAFNKLKMPMVVDYEHGQELKAPNGEEAPAAGWIEELEVRNGELWARVDWTERAKTAINAREYRFLSPAFSYNDQREIMSFSSVGLTNKPNLVMQALNSRQSNAVDATDWSAVSKALGTTVSDQNGLLAALNNKDEAKSTKEAETIVDSFIEKAVFAPSQRDFLIATCRTQGIEQFTAFASANTGFSYLNDGLSIPNKAINKKSNLDDTQLAVCRSVGVTEEQFINVINKEK